MNYDLIIIGGGPAGAAAGVYAARKQIKTLLIAESFGGQSTESNEIQNWVGTIAISGLDLAKDLKEHVRFYAAKFVEIKEGEKAQKIDKVGQEDFLVTTNKGSYNAKMILVSTGSLRRKLDIPGAKEFEGKGITYCVSCDGPFFEGKDVAVIGGGNAGFESALQLLTYCKSVTLISHNKFHADPVTMEEVLANPKMKAVSNAMPVEIKGDPSKEGQTGNMVKSLIYEISEPSPKREEIPVEGVFVEIGNVPSTSFAAGLTEMDEFGRIKIDFANQRTSVPGIWAAGDCTNILYHQNNIAAGDAVTALEDICIELHKAK